MPETINAYENSEKKHNLQELKSFEENIESFTINAEEAAQILGVNRSRLSQLTSKGAFTFERRKIETRNRLFYKLSDLLNHQRSQMQSSHHTNPYHVETTFKYDAQGLDSQPKSFPIEEDRKNLNGTLDKILNRNKSRSRYINLNLAKDIHLKEFINQENTETKNNILFIKEKLIQHEEMIEKTKHESIKKENMFLKYFKENNNSISNIQHNISQLTNETNKLNEINQIFKYKDNRKINEEARIRCLWKKKKAKYTSKLAAGR